MRRQLTCFLLLFAGIAPLCLHAQVPKQARRPPGNLEGWVRSANGTPAANAQVVWQSADGTKPHALRTDSKGYFRISRLRPGLYDLRATLKGESSEWAHNILVRPGSGAEVTVQLLKP